MDKIPIEILCLIFQFLNFKELKNIIQVCKYFHETVFSSRDLYQKFVWSFNQIIDPGNSHELQVTRFPNIYFDVFQNDHSSKISELNKFQTQTLTLRSSPDFFLRSIDEILNCKLVQLDLIIEKDYDYDFTKVHKFLFSPFNKIKKFSSNSDLLKNLSIEGHSPNQILEELEVKVVNGETEDWCLFLQHFHKLNKLIISSTANCRNFCSSSLSGLKLKTLELRDINITTLKYGIPSLRHLSVRTNARTYQLEPILSANPWLESLCFISSDIFDRRRHDNITELINPTHIREITFMGSKESVFNFTSQFFWKKSKVELLIVSFPFQKCQFTPARYFEELDRMNTNSIPGYPAIEIFFKKSQF